MRAKELQRQAVPSNINKVLRLTLAAGAFRIGSAAADADDRIIYNSATGGLYFDTDGSEAAGYLQFAQLATGLALTNAGFLIV